MVIFSSTYSHKPNYTSPFVI